MLDTQTLTRQIKSKPASFIAKLPRLANFKAGISHKLRISKLATPPKLAKSLATLALAAGLSSSLGGCAAPVIGALTVADMMTGFTTVSTIVTGKGTNEHLASALTGQDCRVLDGMFNQDRDICEQAGSYATSDDFKGIAGLFDSDDVQIADVRQGEWGPLATTPHAETEHPSTPVLAHYLAEKQQNQLVMADLPPGYFDQNMTDDAAENVLLAEALAPVASSEATGTHEAAATNQMAELSVLPVAKPERQQAQAYAGERVILTTLPVAKPSRTVQVAVLPRPKPDLRQQTASTSNADTAEELLQSNAVSTTASPVDKTDATEHVTEHVFIWNSLEGRVVGHALEVAKAGSIATTQSQQQNTKKAEVASTANSGNAEVVLDAVLLAKAPEAEDAVSDSHSVSQPVSHEVTVQALSMETDRPQQTAERPAPEAASTKATSASVNNVTPGIPALFPSLM